MTDSAGGVGEASGGSGIGGDSGMCGGSDSKGSEGLGGGLNSGVSTIGGSLDDAKTSSQSPAGNTLANSPTTADTLSQTPTTADRLCSAPTTAEQLSAAPTAASQLTAQAPAPNDNGGVTDLAEAGLQGLSALAAREGIAAEQARNGYNAAVSHLDPKDVQSRTAAKASARATTPPATRAVIEATRPELGPKPGSVGSANKTNIGANQLAGRLGNIGRGFAVAGVALGAARIATADNKAEEAARVAGSALSGIAAGALVGAKLGALGANPITIGAGAVIGGIVGGIAGEKTVDAALGLAKSWL
ncbi:MAG: hypothetical protein JAY82_06330 [Candidatus Thiodiazotropha taylori]|nr:hypothetical protein [Candidatus Thiodiazotropha taylori]